VVGGGNHVVDRGGDPVPERGLVDAAGQVAVGHAGPFLGVLRLDLLDRDVDRHVAVVLGEAFVDLDGEPEGVGHRPGSLDRPLLGTADQPRQREPLQCLRQPLRLLHTFVGQVRVGALSRFAAQRKRVPDE
jgi:hypothetical protein